MAKTNSTIAKTTAATVTTCGPYRRQKQRRAQRLIARLIETIV